MSCCKLLSLVNKKSKNICKRNELISIIYPFCFVKRLWRFKCLACGNNKWLKSALLVCYTHYRAAGSKWISKKFLVNQLQAI